MRYTVDKSITLEFLTDASRSMYFPAQITPVEASLTYRYFPYNHTDIIGTFDIVLTKTLTDENAAADNAPLNHETKEVGNEREVYTLTVTYNPTNESASEIYGQTTSGKSAGKVADGYDADTGELIQSENTHKIHVFAKNLEIQKLAYANSKDGTGDSEKFVVEVLNNPGVTLPATGGPGTTMLYFLGIILIGIAGAALIIKRRMKAA